MGRFVIFHLFHLLEERCRNPGKDKEKRGEGRKARRRVKYPDPSLFPERGGGREVPPARKRRRTQGQECSDAIPPPFSPKTISARELRKRKKRGKEDRPPTTSSSFFSLLSRRSHWQRWWGGGKGGRKGKEINRKRLALTLPSEKGKEFMEKEKRRKGLKTNLFNLFLLKAPRLA